jgi:hypothetical protein
MKNLAGEGDNDGVSLTSALHPTTAQALRISTQNNDINQLQNSYQGMQQYGAGGLGGGGAGGGSMLSNIAKNLGFK